LGGRRDARPTVAIEGATRSGLSAHLKSWWVKAGAFDKKWTRGSVLAVVVSLLGWLIYASSKPGLEQHLREVGFADPANAAQIAGFSIREVGLFIVFLVLTLGLLILILSGWFAGRRARWGGVLLGALLVVDLGRANLPWIIYWDYKDKYATNPVIDFLREKPYEHRVAIFPAQRFLQMDRVPPEAQQIISTLDGIYQMEWVQHHFQYYNIQSLDVVQMPRQPVDYVAFESMLARTPARRWELTNTRYLIAPVMLRDFLNQQIDPARRFQIAERFDIVPKPGQTELRTYDQFTAVANTNGQYAIYTFGGALPRAKLYSNWQMATNDQAAVAQLRTNALSVNELDLLRQTGTNDFLTLRKLASPSFDPEQAVFVAESSRPSFASAPGTNAAAGAIKFVSYAPKNLVLQATTTAPSILLLNDKYDPNWKVIVDGKPDTVLRCNYLMRGVQVPAGEHRIEFRFEPPITGLYISLTAIALGLGLIGFLVLASRSASQATPSAPPPEPTAKPTPTAKP